MLLVTVLYLLILALLDRYVQSNRGYTEPLCSNMRKRKKSHYVGVEMNGSHEPMVQVVNLQKQYNNKVHALRGVSVDLDRGEIVSLLGQNGAGKSTLINILVGALSLTRGDIIVDGKSISTQIGEIRKIIGVCPQFDILW